ncbi:hypothetical protein MMC17_002452 [Xylographa soralifera]|nr:hypothetical protein [Xylographa soralifera]
MEPRRISENGSEQSWVMVNPATSDDFTHQLSRLKIEPSPEELLAIESLKRELGTDPSKAQHLIRRGFETKAMPNPWGSIRPDAGQALDRSLGPFVDSSGQSIFIDIIKPTVAPLIAIQRVGNPLPLLLCSPGTLSGTVSTIALNAGSIWFPAQQFTNAAPASSYVGLQIQSGTISFSTPVVVGAVPIVVSGGIVVTATLQLVAAAPTALIDNAAVQTPSNATFSFTASGSSLAHTGASSLTAFGTTVQLSYSTAPAQYDSIFSRVLFPLVPNKSSFTAISGSSQLMTVSGSATISVAAWSLPVTIATDTTTLGSAAGSGGISLNLAAGLEALLSSDNLPINCGPCTLLVEPSMFEIGGLSATAPNSALSLSLYNLSNLTFRSSAPFAFVYISESVDLEVWAMATTLVATLDQPRTINNNRVRLSGPAVFELMRNGMTTKLTARGTNATANVSAQSFALKNLLLRATDPTSILVTGIYTNNSVPQGIATLGFNLASVLPFLPDPYATNLDFSAPSSTARVGALTMVLTWQSTTAVVINISLPTATSSSAELITAPAQTKTKIQVEDQHSTLIERIKSTSVLAVESRGSPTYLDLSTNVSQFGVLIGDVATGSLSISNLYLEAPNNTVGVITLPAVQWEPVVTVPDPAAFPTPLTYPDCGETFVMVTESVTLVPIAPRQAIDGILGTYNSSAPQEVAARFTLPFGMEATTQLVPSTSILFSSPGLRQVQPTFSSSNLTGGDQISFTPASSRLLHPIGQVRSPSLQGSTTLLQNALYNGTSTTSTVLSPIDGAFNPTFGPSGSNPSIPITRIDISGFGESTFSDWRNPADAAATISKVNFNVMLGRTSREVVQLYSIKYPWGTQVVRTITIDRQNSGVVVRSDSGWQAVSQGLYQYPKPGITTNSGVVLGITNIANIRDTGSTFTTPDGSQLMGVIFDCGVIMENVVKGAGPDGTVPGRNLLGYVQLTDRTALPPLGQLADDQYADLINAVGPMGGQIDCVININKSGLLMRIKSIGVAATTSSSGSIEFVMQAGGAPVLPGGGLWSFVSQGSSDPSPNAVDPINGVPLIRRNATTVAPITNYPYIFQNGVDLLPSSPATYICLMHSTGTQRLIFPQPMIESTGPSQITSTITPFLADPYVLATATGPFCHVNLCIPFNNANYSLAISSTGDLKLQLPQPSFTTNTQPRVLRSSKTLETIAYCSDEKDIPSVVTISIDTSLAKPWSISITNMSLATSSGSLGEVVRIVGDIESDSQTPTQIVNSRVLFGKALQPVQTVVSFLDHFGQIPAPTVAMTNDWQIQAGLKFDFAEYLKAVPALASLIKQFVVDLDFKLVAEITAQDTTMDAEFEVTLKFKTPFGLDVIGLASFEIHMADEGNTYIITLGAGLGVSFDCAGFDAIAYFAVTQSLIIGDDIFGLGTGTLLKGSIDLEIVEVDIEVEASMAVIKVSCTGPNGDAESTIWGFAQATIAVEISIAFIIDIGFSWSTEWKNNFNGGPCPLVGV